MNQNPRLHSVRDLELTRLFRAPPAAFWRCWAEAPLLAKWWSPSPMLTTEAVIDLFAGGRFHTLMLHHNGSYHPVEACILDVVPQQRIVFTDLMEQGFRPAVTPAVGYTATITLTAESGGTRYTARLQHKTAAARQRHEDDGFHEAWGIAASQLGALADSLRG
jgi:uncharacterized protein YndB with AHSA1/START domain